MTVLTVRNLDEGVWERLKARAVAHGQSMESEARVILSEAVAPRSDGSLGLGTRITALFADEPALEISRGSEPAPVAEFPT